MSYLIFDIETVPDTALWSPETAPKKRGAAADSSPFPPHYAHRPIAIGIIALSDELEPLQLICAGTVAFKDDEAALLTAWNQYVDQARPVLVSYNGRGFDMPVLQLRALKHGIPTGWYSPAHRKKYSEELHIDLMDQATEYGTIPFKGFSLDTMCKFIGLPGKLGFDGSMVAAAFAAGKAVEIERYCLEDCAQTALLFMRYMLMRGRVPLDKYRFAVEKFLNTCGSTGMFNELIAGVDRKRLLLET